MVAPLPIYVGKISKESGTEGGVYSSPARVHVRDPNGAQVYQQSVTLRAHLDSTPPPPVTEWFFWGITRDQLPVLVSIVLGCLLIFISLCLLLMWHCCKQRTSHRDKIFGLENGEEDSDGKDGSQYKINESDSVVFLGSKYGIPTYHSRLLDGMDDGEVSGCLGGITRSQSAPMSSQQSKTLGYPTSAHLVAYHVAPPQTHDNTGALKKCCKDLTARLSAYASSTVLDEVVCTNQNKQPNSDTFKTHSLPGWVRSRQRPLSTEDDLGELYAKVNFTKKRKNRMRNDSACAIAINKSRSHLLNAQAQFPQQNKDTDRLVDNEAVVVYDERTAL